MTLEEWRKETDERLKTEWPTITDDSRDNLKAVVRELSFGRSLQEAYIVKDINF